MFMQSYRNSPYSLLTISNLDYSENSEIVKNINWHSKKHWNARQLIMGLLSNGR